ncbi:MAG: hypothetical protein QOE70_826 [Chthoniobacter sp.]|jgi:hypothetical protein|nr:hypothetical protein [Chthoniobacter sp.]
MKWIDRAERNFGHLAIPNLIRLITAFNALVFVLYKLNPSFLDWLRLDPEAVLRGEVWRLVSYIFIPNVGGPIYDWLIAALYIWYLWWIGDGLEHALGSFRVNVFYLLGMLGTTIAAFFSPSANFATAMLNSSLFFAFARFYPEEMIYVMALVPVKVKWLAWISGAFLVLGFIGNGWDYRLAVVAAFANYFIFFGKEIFQDAVQRRETSVRRRRFASNQRSEDEALHCCTVCGRTEHAAPDLEFRVAKDGHEYCLEHLPKVSAPADL